MSDKNIQVDAGNSLLQSGVKFLIPLFWGLKIPIIIRPLKPGALIEISRELAKMSDITESESMISEALKNAGNYEQFVNIISIAWANSPLKPLRKRLVAWLVKWFAPVEMLGGMISSTFVLCDPERFFFLMALSKGKNFLKPIKTQEKQKVETASGEH